MHFKANTKGGIYMNELQVASLSTLEERIERGLKTFVEVGMCLLEIRDRRLYKEKGYSRFEDYCQEQWGWSRNYANKQIEAAKTVGILGTIVPIPKTETQVRELSPLIKADEQEAVKTWQELRATHGDNITASIIREAVQDKLKPQAQVPVIELPAVENKPHVSHNSGNNEWYTPAEYIEAARRTMGSIDLDPASCEVANRVVKAENIYTIDDDGLTQQWYGNIWLNPPYAGELIKQFAEKLVSSDFEQAIVLVNNATETAWFNTLIEAATAVVFPRGRVRFYMPDGATGAPLQGQAVLYVGDNPEDFMREFAGFGWGAIL